MIPSRMTEIQKVVVRIDDVDVPNRVAHGRDKTNVVIQTSWRTAPGGVLRIPNQGEKWVASRIGHGQWQLEGKWDSLDEHAIVKAEMKPGDSRLDADGAMFLSVESAIMNGRGIGTTIKDNYYSTTAWTSTTLSSDPATHESIQPVLNGILLSPDLYSVNGRIITFNAPLALGSLVVTYQVWQAAMDDAGAVVGKAAVSGADLYTP